MPAAALFAGFLTLAAACPTTPRTPEGLKAAEAQWIAALNAGDQSALSCLLDPAFADNDWRGRVRTRAEVLAALSNRSPSGEAVLSDLQVQLAGEVGVVRGLSASRDAAGKLSRRARFIDVFIHRGGRWVAIAAQETPVLD